MWRLKNKKKKQFGETLIDNELAALEQLRRALDMQKESGEKPGNIQKDMGVISKQDMIEILGLQLGIPQVVYIKLIDPAAVKAIPIILPKTSHQSIKKVTPCCRHVIP